MNNYPIVDAVLKDPVNASSSPNAIVSRVISAVTDGFVVLRNVTAGYDVATGVGTLEIKDGSTVVFTQPIQGDGREFNFGHFPVVSSEGASMTVTVSGGGGGSIGYFSANYQ